MACFLLKLSFRYGSIHASDKAGVFPADVAVTVFRVVLRLLTRERVLVLDDEQQQSWQEALFPVQAPGLGMDERWRDVRQPADLGHPPVLADPFFTEGGQVLGSQDLVG
jgi:hypothetical protein